MKSVCRIAMGLVVAGVAGGAGADALLSDLIANNGVVVVGDKMFSGFTYAATGDMPDASAINVADLIDGGGNFGLQFQGAFMDLAGGGASDALITFDVTVIGSGMQISGANLGADLAIINGSGGASFGAITETFLTANATDQMTVFTGAAGTQLLDSVTFAQPVTTLMVQKDILLFAVDGDADAVTMSFVDQTFPQVPEPGSLALIGLGTVALLRRRR